MEASRHSFTPKLATFEWLPPLSTLEQVCFAPSCVIMITFVSLLVAGDRDKGEHSLQDGRVGASAESVEGDKSRELPSQGPR